MKGSLNGVRVKFSNGWGLYGTPLMELLLFLSDGKVVSVDKILFSDRLVSARELASLVGRIISGGAVFGNISRIMTRYCSISVASAQDWDKFYLDQYCVRELYFWEANLKRLNCSVVADSPYRVSNYVVYSDAGATGCGAHLDINGEQVCNKQWDLEERRKSSRWRELSAILLT